MFDTGYFSTHEVVVLMRSWFAGTVPSAPRDVAFECSPQAAATLKRSPSVSDRLPGALVGSLYELTQLPVITRPDLDDGEWRLTAPVGGLDPVTVVVREGNTRDGKPTALDREYWLVEFHLVTRVTPELVGWPEAEKEVRRRVVRYALGHGHKAGQRDVKVTRMRPEDGPPWLSWIYRADLFVPREPVSYPAECADWLCHNPSHWADADPVDEPAVFAGVVTEKLYVEGLMEAPGGFRIYGIDDIVREQLAHRRSRQAHGKPLWTIDVRPKERADG